MSHARFIIGDALEVLRTLPDDSADLVLTSPPFLALRSYLPADHPSKHLEMGSEPDPGAYIDSLMAVIVECRRVLAPHGSMCIELGDTYAGALEKGWPLPKSLSLVPQTLAFTLAYGRNPHTGIEYEPWRVRNIIRWVRPNPPVGGLGDKFRPATSEMVVACVSSSRYFDLDAVREPYAPITIKKKGGKNPLNGPSSQHHHGGRMERALLTHAGAPPLDWWNIPTHPYKGAHYATMPPELCVKPVKAMCPERVCVTCGEPSRRIVETNYEGIPPMMQGPGQGRNHRNPITVEAERFYRGSTLGWSDCGHDTWRPGLVLDPFAGSGTTLAVATGHGRDAIGIDLDERNADLAEQRIGPMFLTIEHPNPTGYVQTEPHQTYAGGQSPYRVGYKGQRHEHGLQEPPAH